MEGDATRDFDPLDSLFFEDEQDDDVVESVFEEGPYNLPNPEAYPTFLGELNSFANAETAEARIEALFNQMPTLHAMLYSMLEACTSPVAVADLEAQVGELKQHHHCIYDPSTLADLLERASAIRKTDAEGTPLDEVEQEPLRVEEDGVEYWAVAPAPDVHWMLTDDGRAKLDRYHPLELIRACVAEDARYPEIYHTVLRLCARDGGSTLAVIGDAVDDEPVLQSPKRFATYFVDKLERAGAISWNGHWCATSAGIEYLEGIEEAEGSR
ncbi:hypothetical protein [Xiamenia xianingshaonis]|uniref:Uncharacterized protein n=1 Tax=Xiamenia xianingshaonis TaxID=2682776 RepID=A0A9E6MRM1_9ACTN|nr:hypothetical protein [Xiamenia xianingshaonis]NHM13232.1 hypothetical protein [Xiamenia xianingshaonis]QTU84679.1 hypothetical protein J7S26_01770 [Xiamenia xianingshaonis]